MSNTSTILIDGQRQDVAADKDGLNLVDGHVTGEMSHADATHAALPEWTETSALTRTDMLPTTAGSIGELATEIRTILAKRGKQKPETIASATSQSIIFAGLLRKLAIPRRFR